MRVLIGADHRGFELKEKLKVMLGEWGYEVVDVGAESLNPDDDEVDFAVDLVQELKEEDKGVLLCGTGQGMVMAANRYTHIRAILGFNQGVVIQAREHNNTNVLAIPAEWVNEGEVERILKAFLETEFSGKERYVRRLRKLQDLGGA